MKTSVLAAVSLLLTALVPSLARAVDCAPEIERQFRELDKRPALRSSFSYEGQHRIGQESHIQGFARIPVAGDWFVASRSRPGASGESGFFVIEGARERAFVPVAGTDHAGGLQFVGTTLAVAAECSEAAECREKPAWVDFYDLSAPPRAPLVQRLLLDGSRGEPDQSATGSRAAFASVTRLADGRVLLFVAGRKSENGWIYVTETPGIGASTRWTFLGELRPSPDEWDVMYQNASLVRECGSDQLFLVGAGRKRLRRTLGLFRLDLTVAGSPNLEKSGDHHFGGRALLFCNPRGGSSARVDDTGRLRFTCAAKTQDWFAPHRVRYSEY